MLSLHYRIYYALLQECALPNALVVWTPRLICAHLDKGCGGRAHSHIRVIIFSLHCRI